MDRRVLAAAIALALVLVPQLSPAEPQPQGAQPASGTVLLTVFLKHDQSKTLNEINEQLFRNGYYDKCPPQGIEVVSWYVMMGIGQVVTLRLPPEKLREVNRMVEEKAWGAYRTEFYPTYDYKAVAEQDRKKRQAK
jgi:hypothetical protein